MTSSGGAVRPVIFSFMKSVESEKNEAWCSCDGQLLL